MTDALQIFLAPFPRAAIRDVTGACATGATVVEPDERLREFRRNPAAALARLSATVGELWRTAPPPGRVVWCLAGDPGTGLDDFEVAAVLGRAMHIELLQQASTGAAKHVVSVGTLREESVGISAIAPQHGPLDDLAAWYADLARLRAPVVTFLTVDRAAALGTQPRAAEAVRRFTEKGGGLGLLVAPERTADALAEPERHVAALRRLAGAPPCFVRFAAPQGIGPPALHEFMRRSGLSGDSSFPPQDDEPAPGLLARRGPYTGSAPYHPQPFDLRVPLAHIDHQTWFELPPVPVTPAAVAGWWARQRGPSDETLARLLDGARMEAFFRLARVRPAEERRYPEVRIYNWPSPAPGARATLLDGGEATAGAMGALVAEVARLAAEAGPRLRVVGHDELLGAARRELAARYAASAAAAIRLQSDAHGYLGRLPRDAPLREDYADFARFVPATLGDALELGSGYGVLAWALAPRARRYTRLDLDQRMFTTLRPDLRQAGVVADMHRLPFGAEAFDSVVANNVLEHLYDPLAGLTEIRRVLRPGGRLLALVPFDALNNRHELPAHHWKIDEPGVRCALAAAGFEIHRLEVINLYDLGVVGAFPTCHGLAAEVDAIKPGAQVSAPARPASISRRAAPPVAPARQLAGRVLPVVREVVGFERWAGRRVLAVASDPADVDEFAHFGADVALVQPDTGAWPLPDDRADLVYAFLTLPRGPLPSVGEEIHRVLAPGGMVVAGFRNRNGLRYLARIHSYFGDACDLQRLVDPDTLVHLADDDGARFDDQYVSPAEIDEAFGIFGTRSLTVRSLTPDDLPGVGCAGYDGAFWQWLESVCGRFVLLRAMK